MYNLIICNFLAGGLFEGGLFDDAPMPQEIPNVENPVPVSDEVNKLNEPNIGHDSDDDMGDHFGGGPPSIGGHRYSFLFRILFP